MADGGITVITCGRTRTAAHCSEGYCTSPGLMKCEFPLRGRKAGHMCGKAVCADHVSSGAGGLVCPAHARLLAREARG